MTLEELMAKRKAIDEQIRLIKGGFTINGRAKLDKEHYPTAKPDEWFLAIKCREIDTGGKERWRSVIRSTSKETVIESIPTIIKDLQALFDELKDGDDE